jgi:cation diffusion facilitator CzcD-associated flavoprotein CzcO
MSDATIRVTAQRRKVAQVSAAQPHRTDLIVVGAGFTGIYMAHKAHELGLSVVGLERGGGVGGTWYWNRYPGLRCDVESLDYSYSFSEEIQQEWNWTEKFPAQPDILAYLEFAAKKLDVVKDFRFNTEVSGATWNEATQRWLVTTDHGDFDAKSIVWGTGILSTPKIPNIPGMDSFQGELLNTATWPQTPVSFAGKKVAVLGTGSSGIQVIPIAAETADHLYVLQRTPSYSLPANNKPLTAERVADVKSRYGAYRAEARASMLGCVTETLDKPFADMGEAEALSELNRNYDYGSPMRFASAVVDTIADEDANEFVSAFARDKIRSRVNDPRLAEKLIPDYRLLTRRLCIDTNYYEAFNRNNVTLVDLRDEELLALTPTGFTTTAGSYNVDMIVLATGFDAVTGTLSRLDIRGRGGASLSEKWHHAPASYLGLTVAGFPNMFVATGPGSPAPLSNVVVSIETHVEWISNMLAWLESQGVTSFEPTPAAEHEWTDHVNEVSDSTLMRYSDSWYTGTNVAGKPRVNVVYLGGCAPYEQQLTDVAADGYRGFIVTK